MSHWLRSMSFALYVPQNLDSRLIVPELDKLINVIEIDELAPGDAVDKARDKADQCQQRQDFPPQMHGPGVAWAGEHGKCVDFHLP